MADFFYELLDLLLGHEDEAFFEDIFEDSLDDTVIGIIPGYDEFYFEERYESFFKQMKQNENTSGKRTRHVPFDETWPTYDSMKRKQKRWYFYWRTQVKRGKYLDTEISYILVYIYELLSGIHWKKPEDGYQKLLEIWGAYRETYPTLDTLMLRWTYDFCIQHNLEYHFPDFHDLFFWHIEQFLSILLSRYIEDKNPVELPFELILYLAWRYHYDTSKLLGTEYEDYYREALPKVVSLADLYYRKQEGTSLFDEELYHYTSNYRLFSDAVCPDTVEVIKVNYAPYNYDDEAKDKISELAKLTDKVLTKLFKVGRRNLQIKLPKALIEGVTNFLNKNYSEEALKRRNAPKSVELDTKQILKIREESKAVREALFVPDSGDKSVKSLLEELKEEQKTFLSSLIKENFEVTKNKANAEIVEKINTLSTKIIGREIISLVDKNYLLEHSSREEFSKLLGVRPELTDNRLQFDESLENEELQAFLENLTQTQGEILKAFYEKKDILSYLDKKANEEMKMPEILIEEINYTADEYLGDIIIDFQEEEPVILEEFREELKEAIL